MFIVKTLDISCVHQSSPCVTENDLQQHDQFKGFGMMNIFSLLSRTWNNILSPNYGVCNILYFCFTVDRTNKI